MASNSFGQLFRITTWGESHGKAIGVVIDGCPAGVAVSMEEINLALAIRAPGRNAYTSPRQETDHAEIFSGVFEGKTTGTPISIIIMNRDMKSNHYTALKDVLRPGHANYTYLQKYGPNYDYRGGGRASARETACRVAAAAIAKKILSHYGIQTCAYLSTVGAVQVDNLGVSVSDLRAKIDNSPIFCPDELAAQAMQNVIHNAKESGDSVGGVVTFLATGLPVGLGDPVYEKLEANLAKAMLTLPASKGFEIGKGFQAAHMLGSEHNDLFTQSEQQVQTQTNHAGGTLGGISTGMPLLGRVAFKPTSSIRKPQATVNLDGQATVLTLPEGSRHDPCVAIRAVPVVDAMCALVLVDALLMQRCATLTE
ncbi:MAG: chorismate synthase [Gammaproteobacteria bacterium]|nr:chorismate synthase [Gammaproteobacteria bacterium]